MMFKALLFTAIVIVSIEAHLRDHAKERYIGSAMTSKGLNDQKYLEVLGEEFNSICPENEMKWGFLETSKGNYDWTVADQLVDFAEQHNATFRGHTFLWYRRIPDYVTKLAGNKAELQRVVNEHINIVAGHYKGRIYAWDVVNEVLNQDGTLRSSLFSDTLGPGFIEQAFRTAHEADPNAKLYISEYNVEGINKKSNALYEMVQDLQAKGAPIHGVAIHAHFRENGIPNDYQHNIQRFADLGLDVAISELNVRYVMPGTPEKIEQQAKDYSHAISACMNVPRCVGVTVWGFSDKYSNIFEQGYGEQELWTADFQPKPAVAAVEKVLK